MEHEQDALEKLGFDHWVNQHGTNMYRKGDYEFWIYTNGQIHYVGWDLWPNDVLALAEVIKEMEKK